MVEMSALTGVLAAFNSMKQIAQTMVALHDKKALQAKIIEFNDALIDAQTRILSAQEERATLIEQMGELKKEIADFKGWETEKNRYQQVSLAPNLVAYALKEPMRGSEEPHYLCANCFAKNKKGFLQHVTRGEYTDVYRCSECKESLQVSKGTPSVHSARPRRPYGY